MKKTDDQIVDDEKTQEEVQESNREVEELKSQLVEVDKNWRRAIADYQNLSKRASEEKADFARFAAKNLIEKLLLVVDDLEKAQEHLQDKGLELALKKLFDVLRQEGVERINTKGKEYDIETMEALTMVEGERDDKVASEIRAGYTMHGSVLRPAQVTVSKKVKV